MRPNGLSQSSLILLLTLGLSILAHAAVLWWGSSDADIAKLPGQRLQVQVSVASKPAATGDTKAPRALAEPVENNTQPNPDVSTPGDKASKEQPVQPAEHSKTQVAVVPVKPAPVDHSAEKVKDPVPEPDLAAVKPEPATVEDSAAPEQPVAKMDKPVQRMPEPVKKEQPPQLEAVSSSADSVPTDETAHADTVTESAQTQQASFQSAQVRKQSKPNYPRLARRRGQEGTVWLRVEVDTSGRVLAIEIDRSSGFEILDKAALKAVRSWRFLPALQGGQAQVSYVKIPVKFQLDNAR
ncbi:energy transducer TonB [Pontibacterium granulatum]|uniref:energy transducer TonB n=1 Tax=Pontibacterium granulatum TaxID=2036029 RepID=UPI00249A1D8B|nr:energy transducer TonB [Pontibacterium granulatum]MDI3325899.1 energy transducer TonB [Pontibacterium granulatum]